jgi:Ca2+-transporting ATPase
MKYYQMTIDKMVQIFGVDLKTGLTLEQVKQASKQYGKNKHQEQEGKSFLSLLLSQCKDPLFYFLIASAGIIFFAGNFFDSCIILVILLLNVIIGAIQEHRIHTMVFRVKQFQSSKSLVVRDSKKQIIDDAELVPGDILILQEGERVSADARLFEAYYLTVDESILTGESDSVVKNTDSIQGEDLSLFHQDNMVFRDSYILSGSAKAIVVATGKNTEGAKIKQVSDEALSQMPLEKDLGDLIRFIFVIIVFICVALLFIGIARGTPFAELFAALIALFVCVIPQGLPVIMTLILVSGAYRTAKKNVLARRLQAVEALGRAQVMVIDKTGTLTRNELMVNTLVAGLQVYTVTGKGYLPKGEIVDKQGEPAQLNENARLMLEAAQLLDRSKVEYIPTVKVYSIKGNPSEAAMEICANKAGFTEDMVYKEYKELFEIPFSAEYQYHAGFYEKSGQGVAFCIGSSEVIDRRYINGSNDEQVLIDDLLHQGLRVISVAYKIFDLKKIPEDVRGKKRFFSGLLDHGLIRLGAYGIQDTLRDYAPHVIKQLKDAGIKVVMATGDNKKTATHLAMESGILEDKEGLVLEGIEMQRLTDEQMDNHLDNTTVYARVLPADKLRLVTLFQKQGKTTVMIGDGVNDAPSLAVAEIGVAMGNTGSEVAKEAAEIILLDDSFSSIVAGVEEGRYVFYAFRRVVLYFFVTNFSEILLILFTLAVGYPIPVLAAQILWLSIVTDSCLDIALSFEAPEDNLLRSTWSKEYPSLITSGLIIHIAYMSLLLAGLAAGVFVWYLPQGLMLARTMVMTTVTFCQWVTALNCRSLTLSNFSLSPKRNPFLFLALGGVFAGLLLVLYVPFLQIIFKTVSLGWSDWIVVLSTGGSMIFIEEVRKIIVRSFVVVN